MASSFDQGAPRATRPPAVTAPFLRYPQIIKSSSSSPRSCSQSASLASAPAASSSSHPPALLVASDPCVSCLQYDPTKAYAASTNLSPLNAAAPAPTSPTPFLTKTYELVDDPDTDSVISWSNEGDSFVIWNPAEFCQRLLPRYFKHSNFASFIRQLNTYGFHKIAPDQWEFTNVEFKRGQRQLLRGIHRRKPSATAQPPRPLQADHSSSSSTVFASCSRVEIGNFDEEDEKESLKKDKSELMSELLRLQQKLQSIMGDLHTMWERLQTAETYQQHMISFISKAISNPNFLAQIRQQSSMAGERANIVPEKRQLIDADRSALSSINHFCNSAACAGLLSGNNIVSNPQSQQYQTSVKSVEAEVPMGTKANLDEIHSVYPAPLKTLDELVADAKLMRSVAMNNNKVTDSRSFMTKYAHRYHAVDGPPPRQEYYKYHHADTRPSHRYGHFKVGDSRTTYDTANDLTYNVANPSNRGNIGLEASTPPQQEARCPLRCPYSHGEAQVAPGY